MIKLFNIIKKFGLMCGVFITRVTPEKDLRELIKKLHPINSELIRLGPNGNGGYLLPNDFENIEALFSPGVGTVSKFETDCVNLGMKVFLADKSVNGPATENKNFIFTKKFIGASISSDFITLDSWVNSSDVKKGSDLLLQMDIEGYEYEVFYNVTDSLLNRFRIIVVEFHQLDLLFSRPYFNHYSNVFNKILKNHTCVHVHPNNCCPIVKKNGIEIPPVMEFTFIRNDRIQNESFATSFPHELDFDSAQKNSMYLPECWYN